MENEKVYLIVYKDRVHICLMTTEHLLGFLCITTVLNGMDRRAIFLPQLNFFFRSTYKFCCSYLLINIKKESRCLENVSKAYIFTTSAFFLYINIIYLFISININNIIRRHCLSVTDNKLLCSTICAGINIERYCWSSWMLEFVV